MSADPAFEAWLKALPPSPKDAGRVVRCVVRPRSGARELVEEIAVDPKLGVAGDLFGLGRRGSPKRQVSLINAHVLASFAGPDPLRAAQSGDNLVVDLDLSEENLPAGTRLAAGTAELEVSDIVYDPCGAFQERFGSEAVRLALAAMRRGLRGRGVLCSVVRPGTIRAGDAIGVRRP